MHRLSGEYTSACIAVNRSERCHKEQSVPLLLGKCGVFCIRTVRTSVCSLSFGRLCTVPVHMKSIEPLRRLPKERRMACVPSSVQVSIHPDQARHALTHFVLVYCTV